MQVRLFYRDATEKSEVDQIREMMGKRGLIPSKYLVREAIRKNPETARFISEVLSNPAKGTPRILTAQQLLLDIKHDQFDPEKYNLVAIEPSAKCVS